MYTAAQIQVLPQSEAEERFPWLKVEELARRYNRPAEWIARGMEACRRAGSDPDYFVRRYLEWDQSVPLDPLVDAAMRELQREQVKGRTGFP